MDFQSFIIATININTISNQNKINALRSFVRSQDVDIIFLQEVESEMTTIPGYNVISNVDHSRRSTAIALKSHIKFSNIERSIDTRLIAIRLPGSITFVNVYAPSGSQMRSQRQHFLTTLSHTTYVIKLNT